MRLQALLMMLVFILSLVWPDPLGAQQPGSVARDYVLGPGDVIEVSVWGNDDLSRTVTVRPDGRISLPLVGAVVADGLTPEQLQARLVQLYRRYLKSPQVAVIVVQFRRLKIAVLGQVLTPGARELPPGATVLDAVSQAGGITDAAGVTQSYLIRENRLVIPLDLDQVLSGHEAANLPLKDRDVIIIPESAQIYLLGEVEKPGAYAVKQGTTLLDVLLRAGGLTEKASLGEARLLRNRTDGIPVNLEGLLLRADIQYDVPLQAGDVLFVPEDKTKETRVYVLGQVAAPGVYAFSSAKTVLQAVTLAGGPTSRASLRNAYIIRRSPPGQPARAEPTITVDLEALIRRGDLSKDLPLQAGDIVYLPEHTFATFNTLLQSVLSVLSGLAGLRIILP